MKVTTLENKFPLFTVENGCIVSKDADITVAFRVELPELFTVTAAEYEAIHSSLEQGGKGAARLQHRTQTGLVHQRNYAPDIQKDDLSFLSVPLNGISMNVRSEPYLLFVPDENHKGTQPDAEYFLHPLPGLPLSPKR